MDSPDLSVWLISAYALIMLAAGWAVDVLGSRSARHSMSWRHADFMYHDDVDGWRCHEDQWLWPTAFDPDKRVIRYEGAHAICGRCPSKDSCSPTPGPREITRPVDPWPYSDAGRFHRGVGLVIACVGVFIPMLLMVAFHATGRPHRPGHDDGRRHCRRSPAAGPSPVERPRQRAGPPAPRRFPGVP